MGQEVTLFTIGIDYYGMTITKPQMELLKDLDESFRWESEEDFRQNNGIWSHSDKEKIENYEDKLKKAAEEYHIYQNKEKKNFKGDSEIHGVDLNQLIKKWPFLKFKVINHKNVIIENTITDLEEDYAKLTEIIQSFKEVVEMPNLTNTYNSQCEVHIGGSLLMTVNELMLCEDYCTDNLQERLDEGWRIVSCCVQQDGRRPDYVLGKYNPEKKAYEMGDRAKRG